MSCPFPDYHGVLVPVEGTDPVQYTFEFAKVGAELAAGSIADGWTESDLTDDLKHPDLKKLANSKAGSGVFDMTSANFDFPALTFKPVEGEGYAIVVDYAHEFTLAPPFNHQEEDEERDRGQRGPRQTPSNEEDSVAAHTERSEDESWDESDNGPQFTPPGSRSPSPQAQNLEEDANFRMCSALFDPEQPGNAFEHHDIPELPPAFEDHPAIRHAYIRAFVGATFKGLTHEAVKNQLDGSHSTFRTLFDNGVELDGFENFARTLATVERRLGVSTQGFITYLFACETCWTTHRPDELAELESADCLADGCDGKLYNYKRMSDGRQKKTPLLTVPLVRPSSAIARACLQPGKVVQWQRWRGDGDAPAEVPPLTAEGFAAFTDPNKPMCDVSDGWAWRAARAGLQRRRNGDWDVRDVDVLELDQRFVALPNGLLLQINIDWFQAVKNGCHSAGALYTTILNNPRGVRYLREETQLSMMFPGPHEPTLKQFNNVLREYKDDLALLYDELVHAMIHMDVSDLPASRKTSGLAACTAISFMCPLCPATFHSLTSATCFDRSMFTLRDPWRYLKYSFRAKDLGKDQQDEIFERRGIRHSIMHELVGWMPGITGVIDFMHCSYLCIVKHVSKEILLKTGMINGRASTRMEEFYRKLVWPPSVSRLPPSISRGAGSIKADNWKTQLVILFVALFVAWEVDGKLPRGDAPLPAANTNLAKALEAQQRLVWKRMVADYRHTHPGADELNCPAFEDARMDRSYRHHYDAVLQLSVAIRILSSHTITPGDVKRGSSIQSRAMQSWARMHCHLTPYFHLAMHFEEQYYRFGPCTGWWTFPYERNNGYLGKFNINGRSGGELEGTMMRGWWKTTLIQELINRLEALPAPRSREDTESMKLLKDCMKGSAGERQGSIQTLRALDPSYYKIAHSHLRAIWTDVIDLIRDSDIPSQHRQVSFFGRVKSFSHIWIDGRRHGAESAARGQSARYGYIDDRVPVVVQYIFEAEERAPDVANGILRHTFALVRRFKTDNEVTALSLPWDLWATDLGVRIWRANVFSPVEAVSVSRLSGHFVLAPLSIEAINVWVTVAYDCEAPEDDDYIAETE
ncbi:hypothetical protein HDZ31DRAFT_85553 [Schizophyllum fasciatum]